MKGPRLLAPTIALGLFAGAAIAVLAFLVARYGPAADGWSFRGNGALAVYSLVPAVLAAGWAGLVLHARSDPRWLVLAVGVLLVGALLAIGDAVLLPIFGSGVDAVLGPFLLLGLVVWMVVAPVVASRAPERVRASQPVVTWHAVGGVGWLVAMVAGLAVAGSIVPAGS